MEIESQLVDTATASIQSEAGNGNQFHIKDVSVERSLLVGDTVVFNVGERFCATQAKCPHKQGPLNEGGFDGSIVTCPWHGSQFDVCSGAVLRGPAVEPLKAYKVVVEGETGHVETV
ncbi:Rieske (2Fe-2S) protein [Terriglobus albidus]|uniref:Rieske (2Fe-2S) protein n=1 Tax=Terriglobus albidus TaxID=1592106 RepID=UPI0021E08169|nr:Rieske 2Fe-2S domain-containing protein [Terriglobus albidus]